MGVLASVAAAIAGTQTNIDRVSVVERDTDTSTLIFELLVHDRRQLASVIRAVRAHARSAQGGTLARLNHTAHPCHGASRDTDRTSAPPPRPGAIGTYSQAVRAGNTVYLSGQIPLDPETMQLVTGDIETQCAACSTTCRRWRGRPAANSRMRSSSTCS